MGFLRKKNEYGEIEWCWEKIALAIAIAIAIIVLVPLISRILLDYWWFSSLGLESVYITNLKAKCILFGLGGLITLGILIAFHQTVKKRALEIETDEFKSLLYFSLFISLIIALFIGWIASLSWLDWLKFLNSTQFGIIDATHPTDPVFGNDLSFYFFTLPFLEGLVRVALVFLLIFIGWQALISLLICEDWRVISPKWWRGSFAALSLVGAIQFWLWQYSILYSEFGVVYGASWTDINVLLLMHRIAGGALVIIAVIYLLPKVLTEKMSNLIFPPLVLGILLLVLIGAFMITAFTVQGVIVAPNELNYEKPYIQRNIDFTRYGFGLDKIVEKEYQGKAPLDLSVLNTSTVENIRILDWPPALKALKQRQELRIYYNFPGIDIDRYEINGKKKQVSLALREINIEELPSQAQTWVNKKLVYTHGYGIVISPVNQVDNEGMPIMWVKDIPPKADFPELEVKQPRIYYGELTRDYIITNTLQKEFDYPVGDQNVFTVYQGKGGVVLDSPLKRMVAAICLDPIIWFSKYITEESRVHLYRNVQERVEKIAPFILWDDDPYIFLDNGKPQWMLMGVVASDKLPYSEPEYWKTETKEMKVNYVRDAIKAIIDPLNGTVDFYVINKDPLVETYSKIYPDLFKDATELPENVRNHFKYPEDLFILQVRKFNLYHMTDPTVFYNKEDQWVAAEERYHGTKTRIEPYNILAEIEGKLEFILMQPLTPKGKQNMVAWIAVFQDPERYGEIICYRFPKGELIYGPMQIEARIDQDPELSKLITLWGQVGSEVFRGNLLVIPIKGSIIYIEPLYLSSEVQPIPELRKVIAVWHDPRSGEDRVTFGDTTKETIAELLTPPGKSEKPREILPERPVKPKEEKEVEELIEEIRKLLDELERKITTS